MKALIVCTNHDTFPTKTQKTGLWLSEVTHFYHVLNKRKIQMDFVSPLGGLIPIDERSMDLKDDVNRLYYEIPDFRSKLENSLKPTDVHADDYRLIYFAGGHGAMWDFPDNSELQKITRNIYEKGGMVAAACHGVSGLLNVKLSDGSLLIQDKYLTGFSNMEEKLVSLVTEVPFYLEDRLRENGAHFTKSMIPFIQYIEVDERLITGQNPNSAGKVARKVMEEMFEK
ncbi:type 1 glutamine amidotransferase domain-containing protein [Arundinibacter roseus]|uniref:Type 1 glutamine amidotransferase domain-containing protein n=1 Tax=Arundinibacter roseus TaxID=2070510 RepID=A0A4R4KMA0_9BACT|nr:type 1 glutamine amidotransferase domain-containing protein [Arundinibacter roseus]TDB68146.1 type 1 glutamine amidotransferase domain-containing protein [Arundinibacter roseus]